MKVDALTVAPATAGSRTIGVSASGDLLFTSAAAGAYSLKQLSEGLGQRVRLVSPSSSYTTIQAALDSIPADASETNPYLVHVAPGVYAEALTVVRDGVVLWGPGATVVDPLIEFPGDAARTHTLLIQSGNGSAPKTLQVFGLKIRNGHADRACVKIEGNPGSTVGLREILFDGCVFEAPGAGYTVHSRVANNVTLRNCHVGLQSSTAALMQVEQTACLKVEQSTLPYLALIWSEAGTKPALGGQEARIQGSSIGLDSIRVPSLEITGADAFLYGVQAVDVTVTSGSLDAYVSKVGAVTAVDAAVALYETSHGALAYAGTGTIDREQDRGFVTVDAAAEVDVTFDAPFPADATYMILVMGPPCSISRAVGGFTITFTGGAHSGTIGWALVRG